MGTSTTNFKDRMYILQNISEKVCLAETASDTLSASPSTSLNPATTMSMSKSSLLGLPAEIRLHIWRCVLKNHDERLLDPQIRYLGYRCHFVPGSCFDSLGNLKTFPSLGFRRLCINKQIYHELRTLVLRNQTISFSDVRPLRESLGSLFSAGGWLWGEEELLRVLLDEKLFEPENDRRGPARMRIYGRRVEVIFGARGVAGWTCEFDRRSLFFRLQQQETGLLLHLSILQLYREIQLGRVQDQAVLLRS
jgi:hypothetical protein